MSSQTTNPTIEVPATGDEKNVLAAKLNEAQTQNEKLLNELKTLKELNASLTSEVSTLKTSLSAFEKVKSDKGEVDLKALVTEVTQRVTDDVSRQYSAKLADTEKKMAELSNTIKQRDLAELRKKLIEEAGGESKLIPSLIKGESEQELRDSISYSKSVFDEAISKHNSLAAPAPAPAASTAPAPSSTPSPSVNAAPAVAPVVPPVPAVESQISSQISDSTGNGFVTHQVSPPRQKFDPKQYAQQRNGLLQNLEGRYRANPAR